MNLVKIFIKNSVCPSNVVKVKILKDPFLILLDLVYFSKSLTDPTVHISENDSLGLISLKPLYTLESGINVGLPYLFLDFLPGATFLIKRWTEAESFTMFENHVYSSKKNLMFAQKFDATPFLIERFFLILHM